MTGVPTGPFAQRGARVRFEHGRAGLDALLDGAEGPALVVVVDVLSFSTAVVVACDAGVGVRPVGLDEPIVVPDGALLAGPRGDGRVSLSPGSLVGVPLGARLVLPSSNGGALSAAAAARGAAVLAGAIRNARAVAAEVLARLDDDPDLVAMVVAAGERWPDGSLRPALEDLTGAGLVLASLPHPWLSAEARAAAATAAALDPALLADTGSVRELVERGFAGDVRVALDRDASDAVPVLEGGWFGPTAR